MYRSFVSLFALVSILSLAGCYDQYLDDYPHYEVPTSQPDLVKGGTDYYGGRNSNYHVILPTSDTAATTATPDNITSGPSGGTTTK